jgi:predicted ATP-grasp superfamily ATP-dependent carboligase
MARISKQGAVVLGLSANGVGALHSLAEMDPCPAIIASFDHQPKAIGFRSRIGLKMPVSPPWHDGEHCALATLTTFAREQHHPLVLYPCSDDWVLFVSRHRTALEKYYRFLLPAASVVESLLDKALFARVATELSIPVPRTAVVAAEPGITLPAGLEFPVVAKPVTTFKNNRMRSALKAREFESRQQWDRFFLPWAEAHEQILIQEKVIGSESDIFFYGGLWDEHGREVCGFTGQKLRQFDKNYGSSTRAVCRIEPQIREASHRALTQLGFAGLVDVEFKRDQRDGCLKLIEVNPRQGLWHRAGATVGVDLIRNAFLLLNGDPCTRSRQAEREGHWSFLSRDIKRLVYDMRTERSALQGWVSSYRSLPSDALFSWRDPYPWLYALKALVHLPRARRKEAGVED